MGAVGPVRAPARVSYARFFDAGFEDLIPIRAGDKRPSGRWTEVKATREDVEGWSGGNLGLRTARYPCVDLDVLDPALARGLVDLTRDTLGRTPVRVGNPPKCALFYRTAIPFRKKWVQFERDGTSHKVEILAGGQYAVIAGLHPSGVAYQWTAEPTSVDALPFVTEADVDALLERVAEYVTAQGCTVVSRKLSADEGPVEQSSLAGDPAVVERLVRALPNTSALFPTREDYLRVAVAIKAALPGDPEHAYGLFLDWCARWQDGHNDPAIVRRDWDSLRPPFRIGHEYLADLARVHGGVSASEEFAGLPLEDPPVRDPNPPFSHAWLANHFRADHGARVRHCRPLGGWLWWDGARWSADAVGVVRDRASTTCLRLGREAAKYGGTATEVKANRRFAASVAAVESTLEYASHHPDIAVPVDAFDADPWLLNTPGGVVNLRTGALQPNDPSHLFTKQTAVSPQMVETPKWRAFLREATNGDAELEHYLQRLVGYCLTGSTREHVLAFLYGTGGNGKGVFLNTVVKTLGSYATVAAMDTFTASRNDKHPTDIAALAGSRLVTAQETQEGRSWDEAKVKSISGGDPISARFMRQDFFTFIPQFKLLFAGNHKPRLHNVDVAMKRRFHLIPFTTRPKVVNKNLADDLVAEMPGILQWAVEGCLAWQRDGLNPPVAVLAATETYFLDEDAQGRWMLERVDPSAKPTGARELYSDWCTWCAENGEEPGSFRSFTGALRSRGIEEGRTASSRGFLLVPRRAVAAEFEEDPVELIPTRRRA